jgi:20S proteasome alpha/beta subunit
MGPDYRLLVKGARKMAQQYYLVYREPIPTAQLVQRVAMVMQEYTQSGYEHFKFQLFEIYGMDRRKRTEINS